MLFRGVGGTYLVVYREIMCSYLYLHVTYLEVYNSGIMLLSVSYYSPLLLTVCFVLICLLAACTDGCAACPSKEYFFAVDTAWRMKIKCVDNGRARRCFCSCFLRALLWCFLRQGYLSPEKRGMARKRENAGQQLRVVILL